MRGLSLKEIQILKSSPYVLKFTEKHIIFTEIFKDLVIDHPIEGMTRQQVFNELLGVECFDKKFVDTCLGRWRRKLRLSGNLTPESRGVLKTTKDMTIEEMRAEIAYQKEIISHLKKLRGLGEDEL
jgi:hypothetical protein